MLVLKQNTPNSVPTPPAGKGTIFLTDNDDVAVKTNDGNVTTFPTVGGANTQVFFNDEGAIGANANLTFDKSTKLLTVLGNLAATGVKTDNLYYANGSPWDLQQPGGSNTQLQFNDADQFGGSANLTFNKSTNTLALVGTANVTDFNASGNAVIGGNLTVNGNITYINVDTLNVEDPIISLGGGPNGAPLVSDDGKDRGTALQYYSGSDKTAFMGWDNSNAEFGMGSAVSIVNEVVTWTSYGNLRVGNIIGNGQALTGIAGGNVTGQVANALVAGTVYTAAQPNITSVGTLTSVDVTGNVTAGNVKTDNLLYANGAAWDLSDPGGSNTAIQFNDDESFGGSAAFVFNKTSNLVTLQGNLWVNANNAVRVGPTANLISYPNAQFVGSFGTSGISSGMGAGVIGEGTGVSGTPGLDVVGVAGVGVVNGAGRATGVIGTAYVSNTNDTGAAAGMRAYSLNPHVGGYNIGFLGNAANGGLGSYAFYIQQGNIGTIESDVIWDMNDNSATALAFNSTGKANILAISTVDAAEGVSMSGTLSVTGNANVGNLGTAGLVTATGNVSGGNITTGGVVSATGNVSGGNLTTGGALSVTGNANVGNIGTTALVITGNVTGNLVPSANVTYDLGTNSLRWRDLYLAGNTIQIGTQQISSNTTAISVSGNLTGDGSGLSNLNASNVSTGTLPAARLSGNYTINAIGWANTIADNAQPNITSVGTLTSLAVNGNITAANITANTGVFTGNAAGLTNIPGGNVSGQVGNALVAGTVYTAAQPNITSVGTLTSLGVTGNVTAGNVDAGNLLTANYVTGTLTTAAQPNVTSVGVLTGLGVNGNITAANITANTGVFTGNGSGLSQLTGANVTGQVGNALVASTVYTNAQPNITSVGTLTSLAVTGNATAGNVYANSGTVGASLLTGTLTTAAQPNITSVGTLSGLTVSGNITGGNLVTNGILNVTGPGVSSIGGNLDMTSNTIINLANPTNDQDAATKYYVDSVAQGLHVHDSCYVATTGTLDAASGGTVSYNNGSSGVGATLTTTGTYNLIDGGNVQTVGTRILVKNEANAAWNGVYTYTSTTVLTRATDYDTTAEMAGGDFLFVTSGTVNADTGWVQTTDNPTVGTTNIVFTQFAGAGTYTAGTGLTLTGTVFSVNASQTQVTALGTVTTGIWNNNIGSSATFAAGLSGANLASITGANVTGQVANATVAGTVYTAAQPNITSVGTLTSLAVTGTATAGNVYANAGTIGASLLTGTLTTAAQPNVTSLGTLTGLGVNGTITGVNITANTGVFTGNGAGLSNLTAGNISGQVANALVAGTVYTAAQPNITSVGTLTSLTVTGNITGGNLIGPHANASSNVNIVQDGNINLVANAVTTMVVTKTGANVTGTLNVTGNANVGNIGGNNAVFTTFTGSGSGLTSVPAGNLTGTIPSAVLGASTVYIGTTGIALNRASASQSLTGITSIDGYAATVSTAAQPNITSVGTLTSLTVSGATSVTGNSALTVTNLTSGANTTAGYMTGNWTLTSGSKFNATYADLAEKYVADADYEPGTVLVFGGEQEVTLANEYDTTRVAGVVTTNPAYSMNSECAGAHVAEIALQGRVPCKVHGLVRKGDLMVAGVNGRAQANNSARAGTIIGKALQDFPAGDGVIEVAVGRF